MRPATSTPTPTVSVVVPLFNRWDLTRVCLRSIARTVDLGTCQLVAVDNGSTDGTPDRLPVEFPWVQYVRNLTNLGFARASNQGAALALAPRLVMLNNDVEALDGWLAPLLEPLDDPGVGAVGPLLLYPDDAGVQHAGVLLVESRIPGEEHLRGVHRWRRRPVHGTPGATVPARVQAVTGAAMAVRTADFRRLGGFCEQYWNGNEDLDLCLSLAHEGLAVLYRPDSRLVHHESASGAERFSGTDANRDLLTRRWHGRCRPDHVITVDGLRLVPDAPRPGPPRAQTLWTGDFWGGTPAAHGARTLAGALWADHATLALPTTTTGCDLLPDDEPATAAIMAAAAALEARPDPDVQVTIGLDPHPAPAWRPRVVLATGEQARACLAPAPPTAPPLVTTARHRLLFVGAMASHDGLDLALTAYVGAFGAADDVCLVVCPADEHGGPPDPASVTWLRDLARGPGLPAIEVVVPPPDVADVRRWASAVMGQCTALVCPTRGEPDGDLLARAALHDLVLVVSGGATARRVLTTAGAAVQVVPRDTHGVPCVAQLGELLTDLVEAGRRPRRAAAALGARLRRHGGLRAGTDEVWVPTLGAARHLVGAGVPVECVVVHPVRAVPPAPPTTPTLTVVHQGRLGGTVPTVLRAWAQAFGAHDDARLVVHVTDLVGPGPLPALRALVADAAPVEIVAGAHAHPTAAAVAVDLDPADDGHLACVAWAGGGAAVLAGTDVIGTVELLTGRPVPPGAAHLVDDPTSPDQVAAALRRARRAPDDPGFAAGVRGALGLPALAAGAAHRLSALARRSPGADLPGADLPGADLRGDGLEVRA